MLSAYLNIHYIWNVPVIHAMFFSEKLSEKAVFFQRLVEERVAIRYSTYKQLIIE